MRTFDTFTSARQYLDNQFRHWAQPVHTGTWQSTDVSKRPEAAMREVLNTTFSVPLRGIEILDHWRIDVQPNLPWADRHFELERVSGEPINPGETWKEWPYGHSAGRFLNKEGQFDHSYAERYWPKRAGPPGVGEDLAAGDDCHFGTRFPYGDLHDLVHLLSKDPLTRQAYLPVWFPEDTGATQGQRVPCSLGYWFIRRGLFFHVYYPIRSCDYVRHYADDVYLTIRLHLWLLGQLRKKAPTEWGNVVPGLFTMWIGSLHMFINDWNARYAP